jgi:hypothetical protein
MCPNLHQCILKIVVCYHFLYRLNLPSQLNHIVILIDQWYLVKLSNHWVGYLLVYLGYFNSLSFALSTSTLPYTWRCRWALANSFSLLVNVLWLSWSHRVITRVLIPKSIQSTLFFIIGWYSSSDTIAT